VFLCAASVSFVLEQSGHSPLMWAAANGHVVIARLLLDNGADVHATDKV